MLLSNVTGYYYLVVLLDESAVAILTKQTALAVFGSANLDWVVVAPGNLMAPEARSNRITDSQNIGTPVQAVDS